ncbi:phosphatase PAP2 family protein [Anaeromyxobacter oryzae]|uniref:Phosphatidic acid phosphatase type 2/haloperoxidase domain-containing protein n=1 Tax=Anaeromyxobacter oryzae TaxID=2918170 RepID=A0ABM7X488_9BACT|nr:phosphatase PAP2 family protein [Anaeromyxobacter oryzae]BDG06617.1 hypothetical protein AMOR_56130 [Anaeromyxobacter oryzae]
MRLSLAIAVAALVAASPGAARGREPPGDDASVYRVDLPLDVAISGAAGLAALVPWLLEDRIIRLRCPCDPSEVPRWERFAIGNKSHAADVASNVTLGVAVGGPLVLDAARLGWTRPLLEDVTVFAEALLVNAALVTAVKYSVQRPIPLAYANDPQYVHEPGSYRAFYSGHTSGVVTALTAAAWTARFRYGETVWPWLAVAVGGVSVGLERIAGGNHFPSDVMVGAAAGLAVGTAVPLLHRRSRQAAPLALVPAPGGLGIAGRF